MNSESWLNHTALILQNQHKYRKLQLQIVFLFNF